MAAPKMPQPVDISGSDEDEYVSGLGGLDSPSGGAPESGGVSSSGLPQPVDISQVAETPSSYTNREPPRVASQDKLAPNSFWPIILEAQKPPSIVDQIPALAQALKDIESRPTFEAKINRLLRSTSDYLMSPEWTAQLIDLWEGMTEGENANRLMAELKYGTFEDATEALYQKYPNYDWEEASGSWDKQQNVGVFFDENKNLLTSGVKDLALGLMMAVPTQSGEWAALRGIKATYSPAGADNPREEVAADATEYMRGLEERLDGRPVTDEDLREFLVWLYLRGEQRNSEVASDAGLWGGLGGALDLPKDVATGYTNDMFNQFATPGDELNRGRLSIGKNYASWRGLAPNSSATIPEAEIASAVFAGLGAAAEPIEALAVPPLLVGNLIGSIAPIVPGSTENAQAVMADPELISPIFEEMAQGGAYETLSAGVDTLSWVIGDPINYIAGAGFGAKAVSQIPRAAGVTRGRALLQAIVPFYGAHATGVRFGVTSRVTWAMFSRTVDGMVDTARGTRRGKNLYNAISQMESVEEVMRKTSSLADSPRLAAIMLDSARFGDEEFFWEAVRGAMYGWNDKADNPLVFDRLRGMVKTADDDLVSSARLALDDGRVGIRDVIHGAFGVVESEPYDMVPRGNVAARAGVGETVQAVDEVARAGALSAGGIVYRNLPESSSVSSALELADGRKIDIYKVDDGALAVLDGEVIGSKIGTNLGVRADLEHLGIGSRLLRESGSTLGDLTVGTGAISEAGAGVLNKVFGAEGGPSVLRRTVTERDGARKVVVSRKAGWGEIDIVDEQLVGWLTENGHADLAAKIQFSYGADIDNLLTLSRLSDEEIELLRHYADDIADLDGIRYGNDLFVGNRGSKKMLFGNDMEESVALESVMHDELYREAYANSVRGLLTNKSHTLSLVHRMPRVKRYKGVTEKLARWTGQGGRSKSSQFIRRFKSGLATPMPVEVNFAKAAEGGSELRSFMRLLGAQSDVVDEAMEGWYRASTVEERRTAYMNAIAVLAENIDHPHLRYGLLDWANTHGVYSFAKDADGKEIGAAMDATGHVSAKPVMKAHMETSHPLPSVLHMQRELRRYRWGSRHPRLIAGLGKTKKNRKLLTENYSRHIRSKFGEKTLEGISDDDMMAMAYADVLGFQSRENGLGRVNQMTSVAADAYGMFHSAFTIGQLAFRPFAWASRVNMEEHVRAWMMGLPSVVRFPAQYGLTFWDAHYLRKRTALTVAQKNAANISANNIFAPGRTVETAMGQAEEIIPGLTKRAKSAKILDTSSVDQMRAFYSHQLGKALTGGHQALSVESRGNIARRAMTRGKTMKAHNERLIELHGIKPSFDLWDDIPEIVNKSNVWMFADEAESSIKDIDWAANIRPRTIGIYGHAFSKKLQQVVNDPAGKFALGRMGDRLAGVDMTNTAKGFARSAYWGDVRHNVTDIARKRGFTYDSEIELAEWYLDVIIADEMLGSLLRPMWSTNGVTDIAEKQRLVGELVAGNTITPKAQGRTHVLRTGKADYATYKADYASYFQDAYVEGNFAFPTVAGMFHPLYGNASTKNPFRRFTNKIMETFGEKSSQVLHRQPAYLAERRRWKGVLERLGWDPTDANSYAHQKAFEMVNYTFFNNQHTGLIAHRMNKAIPFFSAWAEVISTWAWKIPSQNYLPIGYARMVHRMDTIMDGFVKMGLVEFNEDGQWYLRLEDDPVGASSLGKGLSKAMKSWVETPVTVIEQASNIAKWAISEFDDTDFKPVDMSAWKKDNYQLAIGSPTRINTHGIMGVNQFQFGLAPPLNYTASEVMKAIPFAGDTTLISGNTLQDMYDQLPSDMSTGEFLQLNERKLKAKMGEDLYASLFIGGGYVADAAKFDTAGLNLQVPGSSWYDGVVDDLFFPFGHVESPGGVIREVVPGSLSYVMRGVLGLFPDDGSIAEGIIPIITGPMEEYQISSEIAKQILHLESTEGLVSEARSYANRIQSLASISGFNSVEEFRLGITPGSEESAKYTELVNNLNGTNAEIMKRSSDNAAFALFSRGIMGFLSPATPRMFWEEQKVTSQWYAGREMAEAAAVRGSIDWAQSMNDTDIESEEDLRRMMGIVDQWAQDDTGDSAKAWFKDTYPSLMAWTQGTTFWGPAGAPAAISDLDSFFDDVESGNRTVYPPDVLVQRVARAGVAGSFEALLVKKYGNDPVQQVIQILNDPSGYNELRDDYRMKTKGLDMWDAELNGGAYIDWRNRNTDDKPSLLEEAEEAIFELEDAADEILAMAELNPEFDREQEEQFNYMLGATTRNYREAMETVMASIEDMGDEFQNPREKMYATYFTEVAAPYYEARQVIFDDLEMAETKEERSVVWERVRDLENRVFLSAPEMTYGDQSFTVPNPLERKWNILEGDEQEAQLMEWMARPTEWLSLYATGKLAEYAPTSAGYLPQTIEEAAIYFEATAYKNETVAFARANPDQMTEYDRNQRLNEIDARLNADLQRLGRHDEVAWREAWPIERLILTGTLHPALHEIGAWYLGIKAELESMDKSPSSGPGRERFLGLTTFLEGEYYNTHPEAMAQIDLLGEKMFGEEGRFAVYARLYGTPVGELD